MAETQIPKTYEMTKVLGVLIIFAVEFINVIGY
jgi:hypothetical protein